MPAVGVRGGAGWWGEDTALGLCLPHRPGRGRLPPTLALLPRDRFGEGRARPRETRGENGNLNRFSGTSSSSFPPKAPATAAFPGLPIAAPGVIFKCAAAALGELEQSVLARPCLGRGSALFRKLTQTSLPKVHGTVAMTEVV